MFLSADQFVRILASMEPVGDEVHTVENRRRAFRIRRRAHVAITPYCNGAGSDLVTVEIYDVSGRGIGILHTARIEPGDQFVIALPSRGEQAVLILCTVVHCTPRADGRFHIGAEFTCGLRRDAQHGQKKSDGEELDRIRRSILD